MDSNKCSNGCTVAIGLIFTIAGFFVRPLGYRIIFLGGGGFFLILGLIRVYSTYREAKTSVKKKKDISLIKRCPSCGIQVSFLKNFCPNCGNNL